ncbi:MAG: hypothetical protein WCA22_00325 [Candidatus Binatus sp.]
MSMSTASSAAGREILVARFIAIANSASEVKEVAQRGAQGPVASYAHQGE